MNIPTKSSIWTKANHQYYHPLIIIVGNKSSKRVASAHIHNVETNASMDAYLEIPLGVEYNNFSYPNYLQAQQRVSIQLCNKEGVSQFPWDIDVSSLCNPPNPILTTI